MTDPDGILSVATRIAVAEAGDVLVVPPHTSAQWSAVDEALRLDLTSDDVDEIASLFDG